MSKRLSILSLAMLLIAVPAFVSAGEAAGTVILDANSHWRVSRSTIEPLVRMKNGKLVPLSAMKGHRERGGYKLRTAWKGKLPAAPKIESDWAASAFKDADWGLGRGRVVVNSFYLRSATDNRRSLALVRLRGKFVVSDPAGATGLTLNVSFQGGIVAYVNGKEVGRGGLPAGAISAGTPANDYPDAAVVAPNGKALRDGFGDPKRYAKGFAMRNRKLSKVKIPASALVKGVNTLAIELHRAPMPEVQATSRHTARNSWWTALELKSIRLVAPVGSAVIPNAGKPSGLHVWTCGPSWRVGKDEIGDRSESGKPIRIIACRNGIFSGQAVVICDKPLGAVKAQAGDLKSVDGKGVIPAAAIQIRYARPDGPVAAWGDNGGNGWFDSLSEVPPARVPLLVHNWRPWEKSRNQTFMAVQPVWVTVKVPAGTAAGEYRGKLTIEAGGQGQVVVPVEVKVHGWTAPDAKNYATFVEMNQSPETLAKYYKVKMWSEEHWKLVDKSFEHIGTVGAKTIVIPVIARARFGNQHGMIRWVRKGDKWDYDTSIMEKYLDTAIKHLGKVPVVNFHISEPAATAYYWKVRHGQTRKPPPSKVTQLDPKTGKLTNIDAPIFGTPESISFWKPVFERISKIMSARGMKKSMMIGTEHDLGYFPKIVTDIKKFAPGCTWISCTHAGPNKWMKTKAGLPVGYAINVWQGWRIPSPAKKRLQGWRWVEAPEKGIHCYWPRQSFTESAHLGMISGILEGLIIGGPNNPSKGYPGLAYQAADFWPIRGAKGRSNNILDRFPEAMWGSLNISNGTERWLRPGPNGALATTRLEVLREGIEEANARVYLERALSTPASRAKLGAKLAGDAQALLDQRTRILSGGDWDHWLAGKEARRTRLFAAAAAFAAKLGK
jgi:Glycoside hydrolase 123, catalytic domain/Glycoside hydrolase 123 N-terminal domain